MNLFNKIFSKIPVLPPYEHVLTDTTDYSSCSDLELMTYRLTLKKEDGEIIYVFAERWGNICPSTNGVEFRIQKSAGSKPPLFHIKVNENLKLVILELRFPKRFQDIGFNEWSTIEETNSHWGGKLIGTTIWAGSEFTIEEPEI